MRSGWLTTGPRAAAFEREFASFIGDGVEAIAVNSATAGLHLALEATGVGPGDEVIVPTWTFTATAEVVRYLGATPVLVDVDPRTLNLSSAGVEAALTPRTRAVIPVHFAGLPLKAGDLRRTLEPRGIHVIEDAAHAFPAHDGVEMIGAGSSFATVFSFYATKTITTGEGGMVVTRRSEVAKRVRTMRLHGISRDVFDRYRSNTPAWRYDVVAPGYKYNLTDPAAAMGRVQLQRADSMRKRREYIARTYSDAFHALPVDLPDVGTADVIHGWHLYVLRLRSDAPLTRDEFIERMAELGVGCSVHFIPLHLQPYWRESLSLHQEQFPVATAEFLRVVSLPAFSSMTDEQLNRVVDATRQLLGRPV